MKPDEIATEVRLMAERLGEETKCKLNLLREAEQLRGAVCTWQGRAFDAEKEADQLRDENARLTVAKLPTAEDYSRIVKEKNEHHARADAAEATVKALCEQASETSRFLDALLDGLSNYLPRDTPRTVSGAVNAVKTIAAQRTAAEKGCEMLRGEVLRWEGRALGAESERDAAIADRNDLHKRVGELETKQWELCAALKTATSDTLKANVDAAFALLGKRKEESYTECAKRVKDDLDETSRRLIACRSLKAIDCAQADRYAEEAAGLRDKVDVLVKERDDFRNRWLGEHGRIWEVAVQRDAAVAELARVREALNVLLREGGKGGAV